MVDLHTNIMIFYAPRVGSTVLLECMDQAKIFGKARAFHVGTGPLLKTDFAPNAERWLEDHTRNGVHVTKIPMNYLDRITRHIRVDPVSAFLDRVTHYIVMGRHDTTAQAVSWHVAEETLRFNSREVPPNSDDAVYNYTKILWFFSFCHAKQCRAHTFAHGTGKPVMNLYYEDIEQGITSTVRRIAAWAGLEIDPNYNAAPTFQKLVDPLKAEYIQRFNEEQAARNSENA